MGVDKCFNEKCPYWDYAESDNCAHPWKSMSECEDAQIKKERPWQKSSNFYLDELMSSECQCEKPKKPKYSFCYACYKRLPKDLQTDLYSRIGDGYEQAYDAAVKHLDEN